MKPIGGFFELELPAPGRGFHTEAIALSTGRACISLALEREKPSRVYLPFYCCDALFEPMVKMGIDYEFYAVDESLTSIDLPEPAEGELLIVTNFFGLQNRLAEALVSTYGRRVLINDTHRFFKKGYDGRSYSFTSARKYFGVPDGAYLYPVSDFEIPTEYPRFQGVSVTHNVERLVGLQDNAHKNFRKHEDSLGSDIELISTLSERLLSLVDYEFVALRRKENFAYLHQALEERNCLSFDCEEMDVPYCYPFLPPCEMDKTKLYEKMLFVPTLWDDVHQRSREGFVVEKWIARELLPLPIDHRYSVEDMDRLIEAVER